MKVRVFLALFLGLSITIGVIEAIRTPKITKIEENISDVQYVSEKLYEVGRLLRSIPAQLGVARTMLERDMYAQLEAQKATVEDSLKLIKSIEQTMSATRREIEKNTLITKKLKRSVLSALDRLATMLPKLNKVVVGLQGAINETLSEKDTMISAVQENIDKIVKNLKNPDSILHKTIPERVDALGDIAKGLNLRM